MLFPCPGHKNRMPPPLPKRVTCRPDGIWELPESSLHPTDLAQLIIGAATSGGARFVVRSLGSGRLAQIGEVAGAACELIRPRGAVSVAISGEGDGTLMIISGADLNFEVPFLESDGPARGQRELMRGRVELVASELAESRLRRAGRSDDELNSLPKISADDLDLSGVATAATLEGSPLVTIASAVALLRDASGPVATHSEIGIPGLEIRTFTLGLLESRGRASKAASVVRERGTLAVAGRVASQLSSRFPRPERVAPLLREALVNALVHRSYARPDLARPVTVDLHMEAVVVTSPGAPLARVGMMGSEGPHSAFSRNPRLQSLAVALGYSRGVGAGTRLLRRAARAAGLRPASFSVGADAFVVVIEVDPEVYLDTVGRVATKSAGVSGGPQPPKGKRVRLPPSARDGQVLGALSAFGPASAADLADRIGLSAPTVRKCLDRLAVAGRVGAGGGRKKSPMRKYFVRDPG